MTENKNNEQKNILITFFSTFGSLDKASGIYKANDSRLADYTLEDGTLEQACQTNEAPIYDIMRLLESSGDKLDVIYGNHDEICWKDQ